VSGALRYAINEVNNRKDLLPGYKMDFIFANECGDELQGTGRRCCATYVHACSNACCYGHVARGLSRLHWTRSAVFNGGTDGRSRVHSDRVTRESICSHVIVHEMILFQKCLEGAVSNKCEYPTFARTIPSPDSITRALFATLRNFNWRQFSVIYQRDDDVGRQVHDAIKASGTCALCSAFTPVTE
jgi:hypothetical protein